MLAKCPTEPVDASGNACADLLAVRGAALRAVGGADEVWRQLCKALEQAVADVLQIPQVERQAHGGRGKPLRFRSVPWLEQQQATT